MSKMKWLLTTVTIFAVYTGIAASRVIYDGTSFQKGATGAFSGTLSGSVTGALSGTFSGSSVTITGPNADFLQLLDAANHPAYTVAGTNSSMTIFSNNVAIAGFDGLQWWGNFQPTYTVSTLPTKANYTNQLVKCSDCVNSYGVGGLVKWSGSNWVTEVEGVPATASIEAFILECVTNRVNIDTPISSVHWAQEILPTQCGILARSALSGSGAGTGGPSAVAGIGNFGALDVVSSGNNTCIFGSLKPALGASDWQCTGATYYITATNSPTDAFWCQVGLAASGGTSYQTIGATLLYDQAQSNAEGNTGSITNDWVLDVVNGGSHTFVDTGLYPVTNSAAAVRFDIVQMGTSFIHAYTNGVLAAVASNNIPSAALYSLRAQIAKTAGSTDRRLWECNPHVHVRMSGINP